MTTCKKCGAIKLKSILCFSEGKSYPVHEWGGKVDQPASEDWVEMVKDLYGFNNDNVLNVNTLMPFISQLLLSERQKIREDTLNSLLKNFPNEMSGCICSQSVCAPGKCKTVNGYNGTLSQIRQIIKDQLK